MSELPSGRIGELLRRGLPDVCLQDRDGAISVTDAVDRVAAFIASTKGVLWTAGNGGSMASALHLSSDLTMRGHRARAAGDIVSLSGRANDHGYDEALARIVGPDLGASDALLCMSVSGNSRNVIALAAEFHSRGLGVLALVGMGGSGALARAATSWIAVASDDYPYVEYIHLGLVAAAMERSR